jgi:exodeoxyribonuclease VII large subunit
MSLELFPTLAPADSPRVFTVSELTRSVRSLLETEIGRVWVEGEICNYRRQSSGHQYFTLKDDRCQLSCVLFFRPARALREVPLADGMHVQARGELSVYETRGQYQLNVELVQAAGVGLLQAKFEALKKKLEAEGLFDAARKKPLPDFPKTIGVVTSPTGAAIRDMLNILHRRAPWIEIVINPVRVQGEGAAAEIAAAVGEFNRWRELGLPKPDAIIIGRGGGSAEDLWAFNEEIVARAIFASAIPVVSAVGHEIDFTIADFVADLRAPTPSAAAELVAPDAAELRRRFSAMESRIARCTLKAVEQWKGRLSFITRGVLFREPGRRLADWRQRVDSLEEALDRGTLARFSELRQRLGELLGAVRRNRPDQLLEIRRQHVAGLLRRAGDMARQRAAAEGERLNRAEGLLRVLAPTATLERGYSITMTEAGELVRSAKSATPGTRLITRLRDGSVRSTVNGVE